MHRISVAGLTVDVVRKNIKNLHLGVYPPEGRVRVAAPLRLNDEAVKTAVVTRLTWIKRQTKRFQSQERQSQREFVARESHYFQGNRYLLNVINDVGPPRITTRNRTTIDMHVPEGANASERERVLLAWYRKELKSLIPSLIVKWEPIIDVKVMSWGVRRMKTKWGSCNVTDRRIWLNLELAKKPIQCLEYIVVHEMMHLREKYHSDRFVELMDGTMPQWRFFRDELNQAPLSHEKWGY
jgi:hypothetical protein